jgi:hypothetical protein
LKVLDLLLGLIRSRFFSSNICFIRKFVIIYLKVIKCFAKFYKIIFLITNLIDNFFIIKADFYPLINLIIESLL